MPSLKASVFPLEIPPLPTTATVFNQFSPDVLITDIQKMAKLWNGIIRAKRRFSAVGNNKSRHHLISMFASGSIWRIWLTLALAAWENDIELVRQNEFWFHLDRAIAVLLDHFKQSNMAPVEVQTKLLQQLQDVEGAMCRLAPLPWTTIGTLMASISNRLNRVWSNRATPVH